MSFKERSGFFEYLAESQKKFSEEKTSTSTHKALKQWYRDIKKCSITVENFHSLTSEEKGVLLPLIQHLVLIISNNVSPADSILLGSTCLSVFVAELFEPEFSSMFLISLYCYIGEKTQGHNSNEHECKEDSKEEELHQLREIALNCTTQSDSLNATAKEFTQEISGSTTRKTPTFHQIAILHGILSCQKFELFSFRSKFLKNVPFLLTMFNTINIACLAPGPSQYHSFSVLVNWLRICEKRLHKLLDYENSSKLHFSFNSQITTQILSLLASNWESPIKGVSSFVKEAYRILIVMSKTESDLLSTECFSLANFILQQALELRETKGKYLVLSVVLQFVDYREFLEQNPEVPFEVMSNLKAVYASSITSEVYKTIVSSMKKSNPCIENLHSEWSKWWMPPIITSLSSSDKLLVQNVTNLIIPWTLKFIPRSYEVLMDGFEKVHDTSSKLILLRVAKEIGICELGMREIELIRKHLHHHSCQLRMEMFSLLCCSPKKSEPSNFEELQLLKEFIVENLNIDSTPFQQLFLSQLRILLVRIRDSLAQEYRMQSKNTVVHLSQSQLDFVDWLALTAVKNTFPGACFQRRRLSILSLFMIFDVFVSSPLGNKRKENPSKSVEKLIEFTQTQGMWMFFKDDLLLNILPCITDFTDEIRSRTFDILMEFSQWPSVSTQNELFEYDFLLQYSYSLCNHPDYRSNDGGAHLLCFLYKRMFVKNGKLSETDSNIAVDFLTDILKRARMQLDVAKENFLTAALQSPIHGLLLALQYCLNCSTDLLRNLFETQKEETLSFIKCITNLCDDIIEYMLNIMKGNDEKENCPSFLDIGIALEKLIVPAQKELIDSNVNDSPRTDEEVQDGSDRANLPELDLLLSCCWHSIKNSCFLLCELSTLICDLDMEYEMKEQLLQNIAVKLSTILITCRHRGVVDACSLALNKFCKMLLKDEFLYLTICRVLLNLVFNSLSDASNTSVTRRSAGLPCLCQAVVSSEENNIKRKLLSFSIGKLLTCINQPLLPTDQISDKTDLPQAHAYHILKALVMDSSLSQAILSHTDAIIPACVSGFSSTLWPIRNGALQLFGVLLPRICGQKKVRDEDSEHNLVSASELFTRCPGLRTYLLDQLAKCVHFHHKKELCSELVPVLSIIAKLSLPKVDKKNLMTEFKTLLLELLDIPVWKIRDLVSSVLSMMVTEEDLLELLEKMKEELRIKSLKTNKAHGNLLVLQKILKKDINFLSDHSSLWISLQELEQSLSERKCQLVLELIADVNLMLHAETDLLSQISSSKPVAHAEHPSDIFPVPDVFPSAIIDIAKPKTHFEYLTSKLHSDRKQTHFHDTENLERWREIGVDIIECVRDEEHPSFLQEILTFLIDLCSDWKVGSRVLGSCYLGSLETHLWLYLHKMKSGLSVAALSLTMLSLCLKSRLEGRKLLELEKCSYDSYIKMCDRLRQWSMLLNFHSQPRSPDVFRMQAASSIACFGPRLTKHLAEKIQNGCELSTSLFISLCESSLLLLQDEDEEIRNKACEFPSKIPHKYEVNHLQFNVGIQVILEYMFNLLKDDSNFLLYLWNRLQNYPSTAKILRSTERTMKMNLFEQEYVNVFAEPMMILLTHKKYFQVMLKKLHGKNHKDWLEKVEMFSSDVKAEIQDVLVVLSSKNRSRFSQGFAYPHHVFLALKKLHCQVEALQVQKHLLSDFAVHGLLQEISTSWQAVEDHLSVITCWFFHQL